MELLIVVSLLLAALVGGGGIVAAYRRRQAEHASARTAELQALDERISSRIAELREGRGHADQITEEYGADDGQAMPALLPVEAESSWGRRLGLGGEDEAGRRTLYRDTALVAGAGVLLLLLASQLLPAATPPNATATPSTTDVAVVVPTGTPDLLNPTAEPTATPQETATPTLDVTFEPTATPRPTTKPPPPPPPPPPGSTPAPTPKPDTTPPSAPADLSGNTISATQINLSWPKSTDNVGVVGYWIYRNGAPIATTTGTSFSNTGLSPNTQYTYTVRAYDAADNLSGPSPSATLTTPAPTPSPSPVPTPTPTPVPAPTATPIEVPTESPTPTAAA